MGSETGAPWRGPAFTIGGVLLAAFANRLPESIQTIGLWVGIFLCTAGAADIAMNWAREKEWARRIAGSASDFFSSHGHAMPTSDRPETAKAVTSRPSELRSCLLLMLPLVSIVVVILVLNYFSGTNPETFTPPEFLARKRVFVTDSLYDLSAIYRGRTEEEANLLFTVKAGKWIAV